MNSPLKAVVDHHVDRPGVEAARAVQLTGTNRLIGLIALICRYSQDNGKAIVRINRPVLGRKVAHMAVTGEHAVSRPEILFDGLGLGRRFNDNEFQSAISLTYVRVWCFALNPLVKR